MYEIISEVNYLSDDPVSLA